MVKVVFKYVKEKKDFKIITLSRKYGNEEGFKSVKTSLGRIHEDGFKSNMKLDKDTKNFMFCYILDAYNKYELDLGEYYEVNVKTKHSEVNPIYVNFLFTKYPVKIDNPEYLGYI